MATLTAARAASTFPVFRPPHGSGVVCAAWGKIELAANPTAADIAQMCKLPAGATVIGGMLYGDDIDTGTEALEIDIGWAATTDEVADPDGFGNLGVITGDAFATGNLSVVAGIMIPLQGVLLTDGPKTFSADATIQLTFNAPANAGGTGTLSLVVYYLVP
jgi:hypothetical protein